MTILSIGGSVVGPGTALAQTPAPQAEAPQGEIPAPPASAPDTPPPPTPAPEAVAPPSPPAPTDDIAVRLDEIDQLARIAARKYELLEEQAIRWVRAEAQIQRRDLVEP